MLKQIEGSRAVAEAVALCRPEVICAYPITPQTHIVEGLGDFVRAFHPSRLCTVAATEIALKHVGRPIPNAALLGGFAAVSGQVKLSSVIAAIREKFPRPIAEANVAAAREAYALAGRAEETVHA